MLCLYDCVIENPNFDVMSHPDIRGSYAHLFYVTNKWTFGLRHHLYKKHPQLMLAPLGYVDFDMTYDHFGLTAIKHFRRCEELFSYFVTHTTLKITQWEQIEARLPAYGVYRLLTL